MANDERENSHQDLPVPAGDSAASQRVCLNCGTPLTDKFCPHCGQKDLPKRQSLGELVVNFLGSFTSFESRFFRTLKYLLFKPGFLPVEYIQGKRERYYHPARAYVFISFVYFLLLLSMSTPESTGLNIEISSDSLVSSVADGEATEKILQNASRYESIAEYDSAQALLPERERDGWVRRAFQRRILFLTNRYHGRFQEFGKDMINLFISNLPKLFFILLPIVALLLKGLYARRDFYYAEHLVFATYFYNFFFLAGIVSMLVDLVEWLAWVQWLINIWIFVYLLLAMKEMYRQPWGKTISKYLLLLISAGCCIVLAFLINMFIILFTL